MHQLYGDEEVVRFTIQRVLSEADTWRTMATLAGHWLLRGYGPYALEEKKTGTVLGYTGMWYPGEWPAPEIAWALARQFWGKGYAKEAALAVKRMALEYFPGLRLISLIDKNNTHSRKLAEAMGASVEKEIIFKDHLCCLYRHAYD